MVMSVGKIGLKSDVPPCPSDVMAKSDAVYWPSSDRVMACVPSDTVNDPPLLSPEAA